MGPFLSSPKTEKENHSGTGNYKYGKFQWASSSMQGWRNTMEDAHIFQTDLDGEVSVFGVFDGHGGDEAAKFVERHFIEELKRNKAYQEKNYGQALTQVFYKMDEMLESPEGQKEIQQMKTNRGEQSQAGCTANVILICQDKVYCANAGDARSILAKGNNFQAYPLSIDHKPTLDQEKKRITDAGGYVNADGRVNGNLNLSRALGDLEYKQQKSRKKDEQLIIATPDIHEYSLQPEDQFILMGCDGIWETMDNDAIINFLRSKIQETSGDLTQTLNQYLDKVIAKDTIEGVGCDNMSAIIIKLK